MDNKNTPFSLRYSIGKMPPEMH